MFKYIFYLMSGMMVFVIVYFSVPAVREHLRHRRRRQERRRMRHR
jgi:UDP-N-acetylmuramyl pentapeptide phosphotransferase/UDP-N-acetylglucosamine-1-phosphate transferase